MPLKSNFVQLKKYGFKMCYYGNFVEEKLPLLFIHGSGGNGLLWKPQLTGLAEEFAPMAIDLPGHGNSEGDAADDISLYCDYIKDFMESINLPPFILAGHSLGGAIALSYALKYPADLKALILAATGGRLRVAPKFLNLYRAGKHESSLVKNLYGPDADKNMIKKGEEMVLTVPPGVFYADFSACNKFDVLNQLGQIKLPALVLCGEQDLMTPPKYSLFLAEKIPGAELQILPGSGHMPMLEKSEEVNKTITGFAKKIKDA
ncbi:MAG: alpha/beta hydrolase [Dethiobacter sp.]|jgi:pimeloyl-ACP methyl ester carboxylesterase|nr:MAG: alpha/beta hydrolase [Dethiobacter sp.]